MAMERCQLRQINAGFYNLDERMGAEYYFIVNAYNRQKFRLLLDKIF
jgi:hypothetical protein